LFRLEKQKLLPDRFVILGLGRTELTNDSFRDKMEQAVRNYVDLAEEEKPLVQAFLYRLYYHSMNTTNLEDYRVLAGRIDQLAKDNQIGQNEIFYLATPPSLYTPVAVNLGKIGLSGENEKGWKRIVIEKPFGYDLESSKQLNKDLLGIFDEEQVYRIDHYLGKETVQNIMVTRFSNGIFEPIWNRNYIHHVEITSSEHFGVGGRGGYYDKSGALRDMLQNHLMQLVALVGMEPPVWADSRSIRNEMVKVLESLRPLDREDVMKNVIRGQYTESVVKGNKVLGYRQEKGVDPDSRTETYVAMKFFIDNWRWKGIPFYIRTGKYLPTRVTEIVIHFQPTPHHIFCRTHERTDSYNQLIIRIQPDEGLLLKFGMKVPGAGYQVQNVNMDFLYSSLSDAYLPAAYERLLLDCMLGDSTLYARGDAVESAWKFVQPVLEGWNSNDKFPLFGYPAGTWGPKEADDLIEELGLTWRYPCKNLADDGNYCEL
jgi:glucose-6-phosphate 1-dehydrogenase